LSRINLDDYLHDLVKLMQQSFPMSKEKIRFQMIFEPLQVMIDTAIPFGLIVNELISNAYKYAFPEEQQGEIAISLKRDAEGQIHFTFSDNGVGIPNGFDVRKAGSIGLQTVCAIVEKQMKGNVEFENGRGLTVRIRFKERIYRSGI
ncbi:sensor histidine kinase, partial [bacterium]|nr:sensor histidine kinase [candidate division CSSED10-310 bacterium]